MSYPFAVNPALDVTRLRERFAAVGRIQIEDFLTPESAADLRLHLETSDRWRRLFNRGERTYELEIDDWDGMPLDDRREVERAIDEAAAYEFQYRYDTIRVPDVASQRATSGTLLDEFAAFLSSAPVLKMLMAVTSSDDLAFADCQATRYRRGDFLTPHNDEHEEMPRRFAYVLGLTPDWLPRWGGLLQFVGQTGGIEATVTPRFNALSLFAIGQSHFVSQVASYAPVDRISVTGWLRTEVPGD